jgi:hypothetical protein
LGLEIPTGKVPGTEIRRTPAERPALIGMLILAGCALILLFASLFFWALVSGANDAAAHHPDIPNGKISIFGFISFEFFKNEQTIVSFWLACMFFTLAYILFLYQRFFVDHVTIAKKRFRKWEDEGVQLHE